MNESSPKLPAYCESNGQIVLTMSREDYEKLMAVMRAAAVMAVSQLGPGIETFNSIANLADRINEGNLEYEPVDKKNRLEDEEWFPYPL